MGAVMETNDNQVSGLLLLNGKKTPPSKPVVIDDPLEELLNEFKDYEDDFEDEELNEKTLTRLEEFYIHQKSMAQGQKIELEDQLHSLKEVYARIKFYLDEIKSHFPG
jgi:hypothetical protein